ncbi:MAG TPA: hypothetical protein DCP28_22540 [Cytophagales bacterium]|nr:hypothetical protein [Cytophagales bacterium]
MVSVSPADGATGVSIDESIQITFSEDIDPGDVRTTKFKLYENGSERSIGVSLSGSVVTMRYSGELASGSSYEIRIDDAVFDLNQNKMEEEFRSTFTVESSAPEVVSHNISQSQTDVDIHTAVSVTFNEDIDASSINSTTVQLIERNRGTQVDGTYSVSGKTITFTPSEPLREFATDHAVVLYPGIRSTAGGEMVATVDDWVYIFSFFTEDLSEDYFYSVEAVVPLNGSAKFLGIRSTSDYTVVLWNGYSNDSRKQWRFIEQNGTYIFYNRQVENNGDGRFLEGTAPGDGNPSRLTTRAPNGGYYGGQRWNISYVDGRFDEGRVYFRNNFNQGYFSSLNIDAEPVDPPEDHCEWKLVRRGSVN